ncbi:DUF2189 domain-containing protein [Flavobacterium gilvum]|uniref:Beta-carotene 15,15'-monooxygenase n=1 Tax=Flavobacterium gilvum TaxID=1492737 RepID=A0AAC9I9R2_9FLAO|nr:hypothetical protein [Flavobacterium gilvum]AOW11402.1 hypothetical protein EM308_13985 [Flavobacterium gilvum]
MNKTLQRLQEIEKNGYQIDFGNIFNNAFENYKKIAFYAGLVLIIFIILFIVLVTGILITSVGAETLTGELSPEKLKLENLSDSKFLIISIISIITSSLLSPFQASFFKMALCGDRDEAFHVSDLFTYYKLPYASKIIISTLLISLISLAQAVLFTFIHFEFLGTVISYLISFITILTVPLIIFGDLNISDAIKYSIVVVSKQPVVILGLVVVSVIGGLVGIMGCCIGLFFTIPFVFSTNYAIYSGIVGIDVPEDIQ